MKVKCGWSVERDQKDAAWGTSSCQAEVELGEICPYHVREARGQLAEQVQPLVFDHVEIETSADLEMVARVCSHHEYAPRPEAKFRPSAELKQTAKEVLSHIQGARRSQAFELETVLNR